MRKKKILMMLAMLLMTAVGARAQATYTLTVKDGTEDAARWSADPNPAREGQGVTVKYDGTKKVKRVTAVMKVTAEAAAAATAEDRGKLIAANGKIYDTQAAATAAGTTAVAKIIYVGSSTDNSTYTHGLALALADETNGSDDGIVWSTAISTCSGKNTSTPVANTLWMLPSKDQWTTMISAAGSYTALRDGFSSVGGTNLQADGYWSSTEYGSSDAWGYYFLGGDWGDYRKDYHGYVRACLAF